MSGFIKHLVSRTLSAQSAPSAVRPAPLRYVYEPAVLTEPEDVESVVKEATSRRVARPAVPADAAEGDAPAERDAPASSESETHADSRAIAKRLDSVIAEVATAMLPSATPRRPFEPMSEDVPASRDAVVDSVLRAPDIAHSSVQPNVRTPPLARTAPRTPKDREIHAADPGSVADSPEVQHRSEMQRRPEVQYRVPSPLVKRSREHAPSDQPVERMGTSEQADAVGVKPATLSPAASHRVPSAALGRGMPNAASQQPPAVHITIGRVEVRAHAPATRPTARVPAAKAHRPSLSLSDYLRQRRGDRP